MLLWCAAANAGTVTLTSADFTRMVDALVPEVAAALGRPAPVGIRSGFVSLESARGVLSADDLGQPDQVLAFHWPQHGIYLVSDNMQALVDARKLPSDQLAPLIRCEAAHEIVHAVQARYEVAPAAPDADHDRGWEALVEGQADLVGRELCERTEGRAVAGIVDYRVIGDLDPSSPEAVYAFGRALVSELRDADPELVWAALAAPPPSWAAIVHDYRSALAWGWEDPRPVEDAIRTLGADVSAIPSDVADAAGALGLDRSAVPDTKVGWQARSADGRAKVAAFLLSDGVPAGLVAMRADRAHELRAKGIVLLTTFPGTIGEWHATAPEELAHDGRTALQVTYLTDQQRAGEVWVATDRILVVVAGTETSGSLATVADRLVTALEPLAPAPVPAPALAEWRRAVEARAPARGGR